MIEEFKSEKEYKDEDIIIINGVEYIIKTVENEKKTLEEQISELENRMKTAECCLNLQMKINIEMNRKVDLLTNTMQSVGGIPPFYT